jgi:hypothetical protein
MIYTFVMGLLIGLEAMMLGENKSQSMLTLIYSL